MLTRGRRLPRDPYGLSVLSPLSQIPGTAAKAQTTLAPEKGRGPRSGKDRRRLAAVPGICRNPLLQRAGTKYFSSGAVPGRSGKGTGGPARKNFRPASKGRILCRIHCSGIGPGPGPVYRVGWRFAVQVPHCLFKPSPKVASTCPKLYRDLARQDTPLAIA